MSDGDGGDGGGSDGSACAPTIPEAAEVFVVHRPEPPPLVLGTGFTGQVVLRIPPGHAEPPSPDDGAATS